MHQHLNFMTLDQKQLVQKTWEKVLPISGSAATLFYGRLFELDPSTRPLFAHTTVRDLGQRHVFYGVTLEHYSSVGRALIWTLEQGLGADFTPEVKEAWTTVYCLLADTMK